VLPKPSYLRSIFGRHHALSDDDIKAMFRELGTGLSLSLAKNDNHWRDTTLSGYYWAMRGNYGNV
jgi:hypothetical protein